MKRVLPTLMLSLFVWGTGEGLFFYFQPLYLKELGASPQTIGAIIGLAVLLASLSHVPAGFLADRIGRLWLMRASWFTGLAAALLMAFAHSLTAFSIGLVMYNLSAFVIAPLNSYVTAARGKLSLPVALTAVSATFNVGAALGSLAGGLIGKYLSLAAAYKFAAGLFVVSVVIMLFLPPQPVEKRRPNVAGKSQRLFQPIFWAFLPFVFVAVLVLYVPQPLTPNFLQSVRGVPITQLGILGALVRLGMAILGVSLSMLGAWEGFVLAQVSGALFALLVLKGDAFGWYVLAHLLAGGFWAGRSLAAAQVRTMVASETMGLAYGLNETVAGLAAFLGANLAGYLYATNPELPYKFTLLLFPLVFLGNFAFLSHHNKTKRQAQTAEQRPA